MSATFSSIEKKCSEIVSLDYLKYRENRGAAKSYSWNLDVVICQITGNHKSQFMSKKQKGLLSSLNSFFFNIGVGSEINIKTVKLVKCYTLWSPQRAKFLPT